MPLPRPRIPSARCAAPCGSGLFGACGACDSWFSVRLLASCSFLVLDTHGSRTYRLVNAQNQASRFRRCLQSVDLDQTGLPHKLLHIVRDAFSREIDTRPDVALLVLYPQSVEDICRINTSIIAQLPRDNLQCLCERLDDGLLLVGDILIGIVV
jgi:hypothetical protein